MKKLIIVTITLLILLLTTGYIFIKINKNNENLINEYNEYVNIKEELQKEEQIYLDKINDLEELKNQKANEKAKYDEVEKWNLEVKQYLD